MTRTNTTPLPESILSRHVGVDRGWTVTGSCHWEIVDGWKCLIDEADVIHQVHGDDTLTNTLLLHEASCDWG